MIILFILTGVVLLGGGIAAILDGLPYLVLERGFTQVIVGTVLAMGGILLIALSCVLVELRRVRGTLSNALVALSFANVATGPAAGSMGGSVAAGAAGVAAGIAAAALAAGTAESEDEPAAESAAEPEPDLFEHALAGAIAARGTDSDVATEAETEVASAKDEVEEAGPAAAWDVAAEPERLVADHALVDIEDHDRANEDAPAVMAEPDPFADVLSAAIEPSVEAVAPQPKAEPWFGWPKPVQRLESEEPAAKGDLEDEFGALRDSLANQLAQDHSADGAKAEKPEEDALRDAESWMARGVRREPWFEAPQHETPSIAAAEPESGDESEARALGEPPVWPPLTSREANLPETPIDAASLPDDRGEASLEAIAAAEPVSPEADEATTGEDEVAPVALEPAEEPADESAAPKDEPAPAASNEGVVGAYQVGDAHFTIFANGSIQARTPDGDYSFASMDELKAYLASEKNRLGV